MVGGEHDQGRFLKAAGRQGIQDRPQGLIGARHVSVEVGHLQAGFRDIGQVAGHGEPIGIGPIGPAVGKVAVRLEEPGHRKEWAAVSAVAQIGFQIGRHRFAAALGVKHVKTRCVGPVVDMPNSKAGGVVAGLAQQPGDGWNRFVHVPNRPVLQAHQAVTVGHQPGDHRRPRGRAGRGGGKMPVQHHPFGGQSVGVRGDRAIARVGPEVGAKVVAMDE